jgi:plastocyanin
MPPMGRAWRLVAAVVIATGCTTGQPASRDEPAAPAGDAQPVQVRLTCATGNAEAPCVFDPAEVTVGVGDTIHWVNTDATFHTVTSSDRLEVRQPNGLFDGVLSAAGREFTVTFSEPGRFPYYCQPHAEFMAGVVTVFAE